MTPTGVTALITTLVTALAAPLVIHTLVRSQRLDHPNERSSHSTPTPRGGGLAILAGVACAAAWALTTSAWSTPVWVAVGGSVALAAVGLLDDVRGLPPAPRLVAQLVIGAGVGAQLGGLSGATLGAVVVPAAVNMVNFMDGINGICAGHAAAWGVAAWFAADLTGASPALATLAALSLGGALGFLPYNVPRARLFLGDVGSYLLGGFAGIGVLIAVTAATTGSVALWPLVGLVCAPYLLFAADTGTVIIRRLRAGEPVFDAHRTHVYQRLVNEHHLPHWVVSLAMACVSLVACAAVAVHWAAGLLVSAAAVIGYLSAPRLVPKEQSA